jgi:hypothetical protein
MIGKPASGYGYGEIDIIYTNYLNRIGKVEDKIIFLRLITIQYV